MDSMEYSERIEFLPCAECDTNNRTKNRRMKIDINNWVKQIDYVLLNSRSKIVRENGYGISIGLDLILSYLRKIAERAIELAAPLTEAAPFAEAAPSTESARGMSMEYIFEIGDICKRGELLPCPFSREQVGRMRGEWRSIHGLSEYYCSRCGEEFEIHAYDKEKYRFCPHCMAPMTDKAVDMVMKRLEALYDTSN